MANSRARLQARLTEVENTISLIHQAGRTVTAEGAVISHESLPALLREERGLRRRLLLGAGAPVRLQTKVQDDSSVDWIDS